MLLTAEQVADLTGYVKPTAQVGWLRQRGWRFEVGGDGRPKVLRAYVERQLGLQDTRVEKRPRLHLRHGQTAKT